MKNVFITGASGCVGHYVVEALLARGDCRLHLLVRDPGKLRLTLPEDRVTVVQGDMLTLDAQAEVLSRMDAVVHLATSWGGENAEAVNVEGTLKLARLVDPARCGKILYFSTASILGPDNRPLPVAETLGTDYIRTKYRAHRRLEELPNRDAVVTLFPTLIFGGSDRHPISHLSRGVPTIARFMWALRWLNLDGSLHFIHAADIARMVSHLLDHPAPARDIVLGNAPVTVDGLIGQLCDYHGLKRGKAFDLTPLGNLVATLAGSRMTPWDRYCLQHQHFVYQAQNPRGLGLTPGLETIGDILKEHATSISVG